VSTHLSILCAVDFSDSSRQALRYAAAIASHFGATLTLLTVNDSILAESAGLTLGPEWLRGQCTAELQAELARALGTGTRDQPTVEYVVGTGAPASEILREAEARGTDLIVMSSRGLSGVRKLFFGTVTERVLRETTVPVLVTPPAGEAPLTLEDIAAGIRRVLVPLDLASVHDRQLRVAAGIAAALGTPLSLLHVLEPLRLPVPMPMALPTLDAERRTQAEQALASAAATVSGVNAVDTIVAAGDAADVIARMAADRQAGLIVMGLHAAAQGGTRMGTVTYRVLCLAPALVLALPRLPGAPASA
jgi:nucleotide-binding universal stress UspA family protein